MAKSLNVAKFTAGLDSIGFLHSSIGHSQCFKVFDTLQVLLHDLSSCTRTGAADSIAGLYDRGDHKLHFHLIVVGANGIHYGRILTIFFGQFCSQQSMAQFCFFIGYFSNIVE